MEYEMIGVLFVVCLLQTVVTTAIGVVAGDLDYRNIFLLLTLLVSALGVNIGVMWFTWSIKP